MGGCQNYGPFLGTLNFRCLILIGIQNGTIILTTTHKYVYIYIYTVQKPSTLAPQHCQGERDHVVHEDDYGHDVPASGRWVKDLL